MRSGRVGQMGAPEIARRRSQCQWVAVAGMCLTVGGAVAWGLKQHHWAPKVATGLGILPFLGNSACVIRSRRNSAGQVVPTPDEPQHAKVDSDEPEMPAPLAAQADLPQVPPMGSPKHVMPTGCDALGHEVGSAPIEEQPIPPVERPPADPATVSHAVRMANQVINPHPEYPLPHEMVVDGALLFSEHLPEETWQQLAMTILRSEDHQTESYAQMARNRCGWDERRTQRELIEASKLAYRSNNPLMRQRLLNHLSGLYGGGTELSDRQAARLQLVADMEALKVGQGTLLHDLWRQLQPGETERTSEELQILDAVHRALSPSSAVSPSSPWRDHLINWSCLFALEAALRINDPVLSQQGAQRLEAWTRGLPEKQLWTIGAMAHARCRELDNLAQRIGPFRSWIERLGQSHPLRNLLRAG
jgi:hypothetical protein